LHAGDVFSRLLLFMHAHSICDVRAHIAVSTTFQTTTTTTPTTKLASTKK
jgi:hypothetical protein